MGFEEIAERNEQAAQEQAERALGIEADRRAAQAQRRSSTPAPPPDHSGFRFSAEDEARARAAMAEHAAQLPPTWSVQAKLAQAEQAQRIGASAIGCGLHDLRESEISWLASQARRALVGLPALQQTLASANRRLAAARSSESLGSTIERQRAQHAQSAALARVRAARIAIGEISGEAS